ncbi:MAG: 3-isopropylmalate dehydrogenase [Capnocytophaga sp.]|nr:3-isopropylmalate dehydrogenase [Capnocytophaga sp.]
MKTEYKIAVLAGDGIGPEVVNQSLKVLDAITNKYGIRFEYRKALVGAIAIKETGNPLPDQTLEICKTSDAVLFGAIGDPEFDNNPSAKVRPEQGLLKLRKELGLYANIRPIKAFDAITDKSPLKSEIIKGTDMVIYRELISGIYFGEKFTAEDGSFAYDVCKYYRTEIEQIAHLAFQAAQKRRNKVTLVDKANVLDSSRLWRKVCIEVAQNYPDVTLDFLFVDNAAMQMILNPKQFDVILTENMFGDIISDEGSVIGGSIGLLPSASIGTGSALFEPIHGSFPQGKGKGIANPLASILSTAMMLEYLGLDRIAAKVGRAVEEAIAQSIVTPDLKQFKPSTTNEVGDYVVAFILNAEEADDINFFNHQNYKDGHSTII